MSKIAIADNNNRKFTQDLIDHWESKGHEVRFETGASEKLAQWADVYYCDTWDNNIHYLWKLYHGIEGVSRTDPWDNNKKPKIVVRALDWEIWIGLMRDQGMVDWIDKVIFIAKHIQERVNSEVNLLPEKQMLIKPGVNLNKFTLKQKPTDGYQMGMVLGDMWKYKNHTAGLDIFTRLYEKNPKWRLHVRGQHENSMYDPINWDYYLESRGIKDVVTLYPRQHDMNEWLENIDVLVHPGQKEAFCYAVGEAMAKGIKVVVNDFYGSQDIWPKGCLYKTHDQAIWMADSKAFDPGQDVTKGIPSIRKYIEDNYNLTRQMKETDEFIGI